MQYDKKRLHQGYILTVTLYHVTGSHVLHLYVLSGRFSYAVPHNAFVVFVEEQTFVFLSSEVIASAVR